MTSLTIPTLGIITEVEIPTDDGVVIFKADKPPLDATVTITFAEGLMVVTDDKGTVYTKS